MRRVSNPAAVTGRSLLVVDGLTKVFGKGRTLVRAVDGVGFDVAAGDIVLIMGPSGSGKTTLLTMIGALLRPTAGHVLIGGLDITALPARELPHVRRERVGFVFQTFNLLDSLTALENVEVALNVAGVKGTAARGRARELLVSSGLEERLDFHARDLSGGEKQRVSIARALANHPPLLLADEPTANLDSRNGREVMELLRDLAKTERCAVVVVSHDPRLADIADELLWLEDGRLREAAPASSARRSTERGSVETPMREWTVRGDDPRVPRGKEEPMLGLTEQEIREELEEELVRAMRAEGEAPTIHAIAHSIARVLERDHLRIAEQLEEAGVRLDGQAS